MEKKVFVGREVRPSSSLPNHQTHGHLELRKLTALPWELGLLPKELFLKEPEETARASGEGDHWAIGLSTLRKATLEDPGTMAEHRVASLDMQSSKHLPRIKHALQQREFQSMLQCCFFLRLYHRESIF